MAYTWTIGGVTIVPPATEWGYTVPDLGTDVPVISGFTPSNIGLSGGHLGERGVIRHIERRSAPSQANFEDVATTIRAMITTLKGSPPTPYHDAVFPDWSGRVRIVRMTPTYSLNGAFGILEIEYIRVKS